MGRAVEARSRIGNHYPHPAGIGGGVELDVLGPGVKDRVAHQLADQEMNVVPETGKVAIEATERRSRPSRRGGTPGEAERQRLLHLMYPRERGRFECKS